MSKLIFIDVETTGLVKYIHGIIQLAYIIEIDGVVKKRGSYMINPLSYNREIQITDKALEVNGHTRDGLDEFTDSTEACKEFVAVLNSFIDRFDKTDKFKFVGYNSKFDTGFVQEWFTDSGFDSYGNYIDYRDLDVFGLVKYLVHLDKFKMLGNSMSLVAACKAMGLELDAHNAIADIEATRDLHHYLIKEFL